VLGCYPLPGWEQKRPLPQYKPFEDELGRSIEGSKEHRCKSGLTVGSFDAEVASKGGSKSAKRLQNHTKGGFVFCCPHRVIYGFHAMLRGESPRDPFTVLYTRLDRRNLPQYLFYDNACKLQSYCMRREPAFRSGQVPCRPVRSFNLFEFGQELRLGQQLLQGRTESCAFDIPPSLDILHRVPPTDPQPVFGRCISGSKKRALHKVKISRSTCLVSDSTSNALEQRPTSADPRSTPVSLPTLKQDV
jgi:hypothetical protein